MELLADCISKFEGQEMRLSKWGVLVTFIIIPIIAALSVAHQ